MRQRARFFAFFLLVAIGAASQYSQAANLTVNCDRKETIHKAVKLLADTNPQGPNTINVVGSCRDNVVIQSMDRLTLITKKGASIKGSSVVVAIVDSHRVTVQGFTINGGFVGIGCYTASVCYLTGNTVQAARGFGVAVGGGSHAFLESNVIQNSEYRGSLVEDGSQMFSSNDVFQGNAWQGIVVFGGSYFVASNFSFLNNGVGIEAVTSSLRLNGGTISGSIGNGMTILAGSTAMFQGATITGNGGNGVHLEDGSFAGFLFANITGNLSGLDIDCAPQFTTTHFVARTGGITNCVEPVSNSQLKAVE